MAATTKAAAAKETMIIIAAPNFQTAVFRIIGTAPYVQNKFSQKARQQMIDTQKAGSLARGKKVREAKDFQAAYEGSKHISAEGWLGIPAISFRKAMIDVCRVTDLKMTIARQAIFIEADGFDPESGTPLVRILKGEPRPLECDVRVGMGVSDIRVRPMWAAGWEAEVRVSFDADLFTLADVSHLLMRVGIQCGVGEGRPYSKNSAGMGWGTFRVEG